jgi:hypothetical protein
MKDRMDETTHVAYREETKKVMKADSMLDRFFSTVTSINRKEDPPVRGFTLELDELDTVVRRSPTAQKLISPHVGYYLSQMSVASICIHQIRLYQPWARKVENEVTAALTVRTYVHPLNREYAKLTSQWDPLMSYRFDGVKLARLADPSDGKFEYPADKARGPKTTKAMRAAEANLDALWKALDSYSKSRTGKTWPKMLKRDITQGRTIERTPKWVKPPRSNIRLPHQRHRSRSLHTSHSRC